MNRGLSILKILVFTTIAALRCINADAQGGWFIDYLPIDSVNSSVIGKEIRIDFKNSSFDTVTGKIKAMRIRNLLKTSDSVELMINQSPITFIEVWKLYVDYGSLNDQVLMGLNKEHTSIKEIFLEAIDDRSLTVTASIDGSENRTKEKIILPRSLIKGVLIRRP